MNIEKIYKRISQNTEIPEFEKTLISQNFKFHKYRKNHIIIKENEDCNQIFFILKGAIRAYYLNSLGSEVTRAFTFENEFSTNLISFSQQSFNNENIQCIEDTLLFSINRENFYNMLKQSYILIELYSKILEYYINCNLQHFQFMNALNQRQRIEKCLNEFSEINLRVKDKIIATYLGITPEFFSKIKSEFYKNKIEK